MGVQMTPVVKRGLSQNCLPSLKIFLQFKRNVAAKIDNVSPRRAAAEQTRRPNN